jgi:hypothetical protein
MAKRIECVKEDAVGESDLSVKLAADKRKVLVKHPDAYLYMSYAIYHIAESTRQCAPSIGSGKTEAEAWAEAANAEIRG